MGERGGGQGCHLRLPSPAGDRNPILPRKLSTGRQAQQMEMLCRGPQLPGEAQRGVVVVDVSLPPGSY